jgi:hypothetical protein
MRRARGLHRDRAAAPPDKSRKGRANQLKLLETLKASKKGRPSRDRPFHVFTAESVAEPFTLHPLELVTVTLRVTLLFAAEKVIVRVPAPDVIVPFEAVHT